jgi:hypothetical protein
LKEFIYGDKMKESTPAINYLIRRAHRNGYATLDFYKAMEQMSCLIFDGKIPSYAQVM